MSTLPTREQVIKALKKAIVHHKDDGCMRTEKNYKQFNMTPGACELCTLATKCNFSCLKCILHDLDKNGKANCANEFFNALDGRDDSNSLAFHTWEVALVQRMQRELAKLESEYEKEGKSLKLKKLKYGINDELQCKGVSLFPHGTIVNVIDIDDKFMSNIPYLVEDCNYKYCWVQESSLSPLDSKQKKASGYQVGDEFVYNCINPQHQAMLWDGMKCKIERIDTKTGKYEMIMIWNSYGEFLDSSGYPDGWCGTDDLLIARCIDPRFWTVEKDGVLYRAYETGRTGCAIGIRIYWKNKDGERDFSWLGRHQFPGELDVAMEKFTLDYLQVPVMPYNYMGRVFEYAYPEYESK